MKIIEPLTANHERIILTKFVALADAAKSKHVLIAHVPSGIGLREVIDSFAESNFVAYGDKSHGFFSVTAEGMQEAAIADFSDLAFRADGTPDFERQVWKFALLNGGEVRDIYLITPNGNPFGSQGEILHLLLCGVDVDASVLPEVAGWTSFDNTYSPNTEYSGLSGTATCRCAKAHDINVSVAARDGVSPVAMLMRAVTADQKEES